MSHNVLGEVTRLEKEGRNARKSGGKSPSFLMRVPKAASVKYGLY